MCIDLPAELAPTFPYDIAVELVDEALLLEHRDELIGAQESVNRVTPARQGLHACEFPRQRAHDWLVVDLDVAVLDGLVDVGDDIGANLQFLPEML